MSEEILVNVTPQETRVAILAAGQVQELVVERESSRGQVGNIYVGRVARVLPGMQSAFVEIGLERAAFLHVADLWEHRRSGAGNGRENGKADPGKPIEKMLAEGQPHHGAGAEGSARQQGGAALDPAFSRRPPARVPAAGSAHRDLPAHRG